MPAHPLEGHKPAVSLNNTPCPALKAIPVPNDNSLLPKLLSHNPRTMS
jgi:hypothetical protein